MAKDKLRTKPLMFIQQKEWEYHFVPMQQEYNFTISKVEERVEETEEHPVNENAVEADSHLVQHSTVEEDYKSVEESGLTQEGVGVLQARTVEFEKDQTSDSLIEESTSEESKQRRELKSLITRLSRYPNVIERPVCEAVINGEKLKLQIISKRGETVKVMIARTIRIIDLSEIEELSILPTWKGL